MSRVVMALSGGLDSAVLLSKLITEGHEVFPVNFQYGSKHNPYEWQAALKLSTYFGLKLQVVDLTAAMKVFQSDLMDGQGEVPEGHYEEDSMKRTVVPGRNLIFLSWLAGFADSFGAQFIAIGAHAGDHFIYPDCRPEFLESATHAISVASEQRVGVLAPFQRIDKTQIVRMGIKYATPFDLTRTCYKAQAVACGLCGSCQERLTAFLKCNTPDPIEYESRVLIPKGS